MTSRRFHFACAFATFALLVVPGWIACGGDGSEPKTTGLGVTDDVGKECAGECNSAVGLEGEWCWDGNLAARCVSWLCVGRDTGSMYCTEFCDVDGQCPEDYRCTAGCDVGSQEQPYCVTDEDYAHLAEQGACAGD